MSHPLVYEVHTRAWLQELSARGGKTITLGTVPEATLVEWARLGFTHVWLMGAWEVGPLARQMARSSPPLRQACHDALPDLDETDITGSPFAIARYRVPRELGGETGLKKLRRRLNQLGLGLILDFIPNHVGLDHDWVRTHPDRFVNSTAPGPDAFAVDTDRGPRWLAHGRDPNFPPWLDTVQVDYRRADARAAMLEQLESVTRRCDGVRCDLAMLVLNDVFAQTWKEFPSDPPPAREFWAEAIGTVKQHQPDCLFLAEVYWDLEPQLQNLGFDYTYDKRLYDRLIARDYPGVQRHLLRQLPASSAASAHFLENHDEIRIATLFSPTEHRSAAWLMLGLPGLRLIHEGQMAGACLRTPVQLGRRWPEAPQPQIQSLYARLLDALRHSAVGSGEFHVLAPRPAWADNPTWQNLVVVQWQVLSGAFDLVVVNLAPHPSQGYVPLVVNNLAQSNWRLQDLLGDAEYVRVGEDLQHQGLYLDVGPNGTHLFHCLPT